jgi:hypothetical protein
MDAQLGKTVTKQFFTPQAIEACTAAHVNIRSYPVTFLQPLGVLTLLGNHT